jgi:hypothetical protein
MIAKVFGTTAAVLLLALGASCSHFSKTGTSAQTSQSGASTSQAGPSTSASAAGGTGASGPAEMGRGRCEALVGAERDRCFAEDRQRSDARK